MGLDLVQIFKDASIIVQCITVLMVLMSVFMFYVITERLLTFRAASDQSIRYVQRLGAALRERKEEDALAAAKQLNKSPVAKVMESGLTAWLNARTAMTTQGPDDVGDFDIVYSVNRALERVKE